MYGRLCTVLYTVTLPEHTTRIYSARRERCGVCGGGAPPPAYAVPSIVYVCRDSSLSKNEWIEAQRQKKACAPCGVQHTAGHGPGQRKCWPPGGGCWAYCAHGTPAHRLSSYNWPMDAVRPRLLMYGCPTAILTVKSPPPSTCICRRRVPQHDESVGRPLNIAKATHVLAAGGETSFNAPSICTWQTPVRATW